MDLFDYAQALFDEQGDLWIPGLGHLFKERKSSYYDAETHTMHPPGYHISFEEKQDNTDTAFVSYFSRIKNLSQGSAKYFVDKFVENLKDDLQRREVNFATLGTFYINGNSQIAFRGTKLEGPDQDTFYGLSPVRITKLTPAAIEHLPEALPENKDLNDEETPVVLVNENIDANTQHEAGVETEEATQPSKREYDPHNFYTDDRVLVLKGKQSREERSNKYQFWILAALVAIVVILGIYLVTQNMLDPANNANISNQITDKPAKRKDTVANLSKANADSTLLEAQKHQSLAAAVDTNNFDNPLGTASSASKTDAPNANATPSPGIAKGSWIVSAGQNSNYNAITATLANLHSMGYPEARMIDSVKKPGYFIYRIILGYYDTKAEATQARKLLLQENKLKPKVLKVQQYN